MGRRKGYRKTGWWKRRGEMKGEEKKDKMKSKERHGRFLNI